MFLNIRHFGLVVYDLDQSLKFWRDLLKFKTFLHKKESGRYIDEMLGLKDVKVTTIKLKSPCGQMLELLDFENYKDKKKWSGKPYSTGFTHIALTVNDIDDKIKKFKLFGLICKRKPIASPDGYAKAIYVRSPEGVFVELVELLNHE